MLLEIDYFSIETVSVVVCRERIEEELQLRLLAEEVECGGSSSLDHFRDRQPTSQQLHTVDSQRLSGRGQENKRKFQVR